jgi:hypothetical protein
VNFNPHVLPTDTLTSQHPRQCIHCLRAVGGTHRPSCHVTKERYRAAQAQANPEPRRYRLIPTEE